MPALETDDLEQLAVLWMANGIDDYGQVTVDKLHPQQVPVRWLNKRVELLDAKGNTIILDAQAVVERDIKIGSRMWLGSYADWVQGGEFGTGSGALDTEIMEVKTFDVTPDIKNREQRRTVGLMRYENVIDPGA